MSEFKQLIEQSEFLERRANQTYRRILEKITEVKDHSGQKGRPGLPFRTTENSAEELARSLSDSGRKQPICWKIAADW